MTLIEKLTNELKKLNSNLGLSQELLNSVAGAFCAGLTEESTDEQITEAANKALPMLKTLQSEQDKVRTSAIKAAEERYKGGQQQQQQQQQDPNMPEWFKTYVENQKTEKEKLMSEIEKLKGENTKKSFDELVTKLGGELGLNGEVLDRARRGLSSDMDETAIKNELGSFKKFLLATGARLEERGAHQTAFQKEAAEKEGEAYFEQLKAAMGTSAQ